MITLKASNVVWANSIPMADIVAKLDKGSFPSGYKSVSVIARSKEVAKVVVVHPWGVAEHRLERDGERFKVGKQLQADAHFYSSRWEWLRAWFERPKEIIE